VQALRPARLPHPVHGLEFFYASRRLHPRRQTPAGPAELPDEKADRAMTFALRARTLWSFLTARQERVVWWLALLMLFIPVLPFLLFFRRYSWLARIGWGAWMGFIVFVKVFGLSEPIIQVRGPNALPAVNTFGPSAEDLPIASYVGKLLGSQYMDKYALDGDAITITYERNDEYFNNREILADLAISNGFSLMFRRDLRSVRMQVIHHGQPLSIVMTRPEFLAFFGITEADARSYADRDKLHASPVFNVTRDGKLDFIRKFAGLP
jgi:hypothetical protein